MKINEKIKLMNNKGKNITKEEDWKNNNPNYVSLSICYMRK